jgi:hypothetical protein
MENTQNVSKKHFVGKKVTAFIVHSVFLFLMLFRYMDRSRIVSIPSIEGQSGKKLFRGVCVQCIEGIFPFALFWLNELLKLITQFQPT